MSAMVGAGPSSTGSSLAGAADHCFRKMKLLLQCVMVRALYDLPPTMKISRTVWVYMAAIIAAAGVVIHVAALFAGPSWLEFFRAPPNVVASARDGTWLAPVGGLVIAGLMGTCGVYAASAIGLVGRPPLQRPGLAVMGTICLVRALLLPVLAIRHPEFLNTFEVVAAIVWFLAGIGLAVGFVITKPGLNDLS